MKRLEIYTLFSNSPFKSIKHSSYFDIYEKLFSAIEINEMYSSRLAS